MLILYFIFNSGHSYNVTSLILILMSILHRSFNFEEWCKKVIALIDKIKWIFFSHYNTDDDVLTTSKGIYTENKGISLTNIINGWMALINW